MTDSWNRDERFLSADMGEENGSTETFGYPRIKRLITWFSEACFLFLIYEALARPCAQAHPVSEKTQ